MICFRFGPETSTEPFKKSWIYLPAFYRGHTWYTLSRSHLVDGVCTYLSVLTFLSFRRWAWRFLRLPFFIVDVYILLITFIDKCSTHTWMSSGPLVGFNICFNMRSTFCWTNCCGRLRGPSTLLKLLKNVLILINNSSSQNKANHYSEGGLEMWS